MTCAISLFIICTKAVHTSFGPGLRAVLAIITKNLQYEVLMCKKTLRNNANLGYWVNILIYAYIHTHPHWPVRMIANTIRVEDDVQEIDIDDCSKLLESTMIVRLSMYILNLAASYMYLIL